MSNLLNARWSDAASAGLKTYIGLSVPGWMSAPRLPVGDFRPVVRWSRRAGIANENRSQESLADDRLERIDAPTLIIHAVDDPLVDITHGRYTAQRVPGARFLELESGGHILMGQHERVRPEVETFLRQHALAAME